jgi:hypothetical protein
VQESPTKKAKGAGYNSSEKAGEQKIPVQGVIHGLGSVIVKPFNGKAGSKKESGNFLASVLMQGAATSTGMLVVPSFLANVLMQRAATSTGMLVVVDGPLPAAVKVGRRFSWTGHFLSLFSLPLTSPHFETSSHFTLFPFRHTGSKDKLHDHACQLRISRPADRSHPCHQPSGRSEAHSTGNRSQHPTSSKILQQTSALDLGSHCGPRGQEPREQGPLQSHYWTAQRRDCDARKLWFPD